MDVSIIVVNYNTLKITEACLKSIHEFTFNISYEIILVDNDSTDGSCDFFREYQNITFIQSSENLGFGKANNLGVEYATGDYFFLLNSDTILIENSIKKMFDFYKNNLEQLNIGALGCILKNEFMGNINSGGYFPSAKNYIKSYIRKPVPIFEIGNVKGEYLLIDFVTGADIFISKEIYNRIGGFDEDFFLYYEETDLQKRLANLGYKNYLFTRTNIIHLEGGSDIGNNVISNFKRITIHRSRNLYLKKHDKNAFFYFVFDLFVNIFRLFDRKFSKKENITFVRENIKSYFK